MFFWPVVNPLEPITRPPATTGELAARLAAGPTQAFLNTKRLVTRELDMDLASSLELEAMTQAHLMSGQDFAEFLAAFSEKRPPQWKGR